MKIAKNRQRMNFFQLLAHEMGHTFGMDHDQAERNEGKCKGDSHIMNWMQLKDTPWSKCSRSDFERNYASKKWGGWCLEDIREINVGHEGKVNVLIILFQILHKILIVNLFQDLDIYLPIPYS